MFKPAAKGFDQVAKYTVSDTPVYASPVVSGNMIYVKDQDSLILWTVE